MVGAEQRRKIFFDEKFFRVMKRVKRSPNDQQMRAVLAKYVEEYRLIFVGTQEDQKYQNKFHREFESWYSTDKKKRHLYYLFCDEALKMLSPPEAEPLFDDKLHEISYHDGGNHES